MATQREPLKFITAEDAIVALPKDKKTIHCFAGSIGADWDRDSVIKELKRAKRIAWKRHLFDHELAIEPYDGTSVLRFDVTQPQE